MKTVIIGLVLVVGLGAAGYFAVPFLIEQKTEELRAEVKDLKQRLESAEVFIKGEQEARKNVRIEPGADAATITRAVNALASKVTKLESSVRADLSAADAVVKEQKSDTAAALKKQAEALEKESVAVRTQIREAIFKTRMSEVRGRLLKVKTDLLAKNIGTADAEVGVLVESLEKMKESMLPEAKKSLDAAQASLRKARGEMTTDLPSAMKRVDLLWHEIGKISNAP
ncbi:MAG: hypothetical protein A2X82_15805 [Geobacteraceae bacterium GWC2_55_20]|nr:MAG: hypothetical protein A2X82_15805 [Geobacteraceae bacterium GWC2_55_20]OGU20348.1 MAG: hypothetical protein A2X85_09930 [Geobacteraceae bacterium GWF2_54_21]HCE67648.1 hypothetical protein [Geobacter sp.]